MRAWVLYSTQLKQWSIDVHRHNAKSTRDLKKLSKCMRDELDKEKGRRSHGIEELRRPTSNGIHQASPVAEREREANQNGRPRIIHHMQVTFSVDQPAAVAASTVSAKKPDMKPSSEVKDISKHRHPATRSATAVEESATSNAVDDKDQLLTQPGPKLAATKVDPNKDHMYQAAALRFPSLFSDNFGPAAFALLYRMPTVTNSMAYGEGITSTNNNSDRFSIVRPTIELPPDEFLNADSPGCGSSGFHRQKKRQRDRTNSQEDVEMKVATPDTPFPPQAAQAAAVHGVLLKSAALRNISALNTMEDDVPRTITPSLLGPDSGPGANRTTKQPSLNVRTQSASTRSTSPSATSVNSSQQNSSSNSAPDGTVKAECANCGATCTPMWRRSLSNELNCNACGLYYRQHRQPRPKNMHNNLDKALVKGRAKAAPRQESQKAVTQCDNCHTTVTTLWRKDKKGKTVCNACGLYHKAHLSARPISMKSNAIRKRARRGAGNSSSASLGASGGHASLNAESAPTLAPDESTPTLAPDGSAYTLAPNELAHTFAPDELARTLAPDESTQVTYNNDGNDDKTNSVGNNMDYRVSIQSELMGALGSGDMHSCHPMYGQFPGSYHPDYMSQLYNIPSDSLPFSLGDRFDADSASQSRSSKCRHMSNDSAAEPPSSAVPVIGSLYSDSFTFASSSVLHSQHPTVDFPHTPYPSGLFNTLRGAAWDPMMPPPDDSPPFVHPSMLPSSGVGNSLRFFPPSTSHQQDGPDSLFAAYLHPQMLPPDDSPPMSSLQLDLPILPSKWKITGPDEYDAMVTF